MGKYSSSYFGLLSIEIGVVAAVTALALMIAVYIAGPISTVSKAGLVGLIVGGCIHVAFELLGGNTYYCSSGAACRRS